MRTTRLIALLILSTPAVAAGPARAPADEADDQYAFVVGLAEKGMHDVVVREARIFLQRHPDHAKAPLARYRLASSLFELERTAEAADELRRLARRRGFEFEAEVHFRLGQCELQLERPERAAAAFARVLELDRDYLHRPAKFFFAEASFRRGDFERAERSYGEVLEAGERDEYARDSAYGLAWCAYRRGDHDAAVERIAAFLRSHPRDGASDELRLLAGEAHLAAGRPRDALEAYRGVKDGEYRESALRGAAFALAALDEHERAAQAFEAALRAFPEGRHAREVALHSGVEWLRAGDVERAARALSVESLADDPEALHWRARAELEAGNGEAALASVDRALGARELDGELRDRLHVVRGDALAALGRGEEAVRSYRRSSSEYALYAASVEALNEGRVEEAVRLATSLLEANPETSYRAELQIVLGEGWLAEERYQRAEGAFMAALETAGERSPEIAPRALSRAGWCRYRSGDSAGAAELFTRVVRDHSAAPEVEEALFMLGRAHEAAGSPDAAARAWRGYVDRYPRGERRGEALLGLSRVDAAGRARWLEAAAAADGDAGRSAYALFELAEQDAEQGRTREALRRYEQLIERYPDDVNVPAALYGLAWCHKEEGESRRAAELLGRLVRDPRAGDELGLAAAELAVWAWSEAGEAERTRAAYDLFAGRCEEDRRRFNAARIATAALRSAGRDGEAQEVLDGLLPSLRDPAVALDVLAESALLALDRGRPDEAEAAVRTALGVAGRRDIQGGPRLAEACFFVGEARFDEGRYDEAARLYAEAARRGEGELAAQALYKEGFAHLRREDWRAAARAFDALVSGHPQSALRGEGLYLLGEVYHRAGQHERAVEVLTRFRKEEPQHAAMPKALFRVGISLARLERWREAEAALAELARRSRDFEGAAEADLWRGRALAQLGDARGARSAFDRAIARTDGVVAARARLGLGRLALAGGDAEAALSEFLKVALLYANEEEVGEALYLAGTCLEEMGDEDRAREQYGELLERYGSTPFAARARERLRALGNE